MGFSSVMGSPDAISCMAVSRLFLPDAISIASTSMSALESSQMSLAASRGTPCPSEEARQEFRRILMVHGSAFFWLWGMMPPVFMKVSYCLARSLVLVGDG